MVEPESSPADRPVHIVVEGLRPRTTVRVELHAVDGQSVPWQSSATLRADVNGTVDLDRATSRSGTYVGVRPSALITSMQPTGASLASSFAWREDRRLTFTARALVAGKAVATTTFQRRFTPRPLETRSLSVAGDGVSGGFAAQKGTRRHAAVLVFGGSEGGLSPYAQGIGAALAANGYPSLAVAYFAAPGLPPTLANIPLEYFRRALTWLARRPEVDPHRVFVLGVSRGSEAALLAGTKYPQLVHGVVAVVPSNVVLCAYPGCAGPAWTIHGVAVPFTRQFGEPHPSDDPRAVIPVERIRGPVLAICAGDDRVWPSCTFSRAIRQRLSAHPHHYDDQFDVARRAGHLVSSLVPYLPTRVDFNDTQQLQDERGREQLWPELLAFLKANT